MKSELESGLSKKRTHSFDMLAGQGIFRSASFFHTALTQKNALIKHTNHKVKRRAFKRSRVNAKLREETAL